MQIDLNLSKHFMILIDLLKRMQIKTNQKDLSGYNAFHYLAGVDIKAIAKNLQQKRNNIKSTHEKAKPKDQLEDEDESMKDVENNESPKEKKRA